MIRKFFIVILCVIGLATFVAILNNAIPDYTEIDCLNQYDSEISTLTDADSSSICYGELSITPIRTIQKTYSNNIHSGMRTTNHCTRLIHRYCPNIYVKNRKFIGFAISNSFLCARNVSLSAKLSDKQDFIRLCILLI